MQVSCTTLINTCCMKDYITVFEYNTNNKLTKQTDPRARSSATNMTAKAALLRPWMATITRLLWNMLTAQGAVHVPAAALISRHG